LEPAAAQKSKNATGSKKKKSKKLTLRGPSRDVGKNTNAGMKDKAGSRRKAKKLKKRHRAEKKSARIFVCDRCGRDDFTNGHALGGHKKYCQKPQYDEAREKKLKRSRKRSRSDPLVHSAISKSMSKAKSKVQKPLKAKSKVRKPLLDLNGITKKIRNFTENVDNAVIDKHICHKSKNEGDDLDVLDRVVHTKDLFELEVIQQALREGKANLAGRIAGLNEDESILSFDFADESERSNSKFGSQAVEASPLDGSQAGQSGLWRDGTMSLKRIKSYDYGDVLTGDENVHAGKSPFGDSDTFSSMKFHDKQKLDSDCEYIVDPIGIQEEKSQADEDMFFGCNDAFLLNTSRQSSFNFDQDYTEAFEDSMGGDIAMQLGF